MTISKLGPQRHRFPISGSLCLSIGLLALASAASAADVGRGSAVYEKHCVVCHGKQGTPTWPGAPDFRRPGSLLKPDAPLLSAIRYGKGAMPAYLGLLKDSEVMDVTAYLRTLTR